MTLWYSVLNLSSHWLHLINSGSSKAPCVSIRGLWYDTPKTNGKAERFIKTALTEWAYARAYPSRVFNSVKIITARAVMIMATDA